MYISFLIFALLAALVASIIGNLAASQLESYLERHSLFGRFRQRSKLIASLVVFFLLSLPALSIQVYSQISSVSLSRNGISERFSFNEKINPMDGAAYVLVPSGKFATGNGQGEWIADPPAGEPESVVYLDKFWMKKTEVTNQEYSRCVDSGVCTPPANDFWHDFENTMYPVTHISWRQADIYAKWAGGSLPSELEWEKACRGDKWFTYPWGNSFDFSIDSRLNFCDSQCAEDFKYYPADATMFNDGYGELAPVGSYPAGASPYGALDMVGNAWEWTSTLSFDRPGMIWTVDADDPENSTMGDFIEGKSSLNYVGPMPGEETDARNAFGTDEYIARGGAYNLPALYMRCTFYAPWPIDSQAELLGFRVVIRDPDF